MKYDFTTVYDRRGMNALAVDALGQLGGFAPGEPATRHDATNIQNHYVKNKCFCV